MHYPHPLSSKSDVFVTELQRYGWSMSLPRCGAQTEVLAACWCQPLMLAVHPSAAPGILATGQSGPRHPPFGPLLEFISPHTPADSRESSSHICAEAICQSRLRSRGRPLLIPDTSGASLYPHCQSPNHLSSMKSGEGLGDDMSHKARETLGELAALHWIDRHTQTTGNL